MQYLWKKNSAKFVMFKIRKGRFYPELDLLPSPCYWEKQGCKPRLFSCYEQNFFPALLHLIFIETQQYAAHRKTGPQIERENLNLEKWNAINSLANSMRKVHINIFWGFLYSEHFRGWPGKGLWWINDLHSCKRRKN